MLSKSVRISLAVTTTAFCGVILLGVIAHLDAQSTGARLESSIAAATSENEKKPQELTQLFGQATGREFQHQPPTEQLLTYVQRWHPTGRPIGNPENGELADTQKLENALREKAMEATKTYIAVRNLNREYHTYLNSRWKGFWLRTAGYPTRPLEKI